MLAVAYCCLVSVYAKLTLHSSQFADNVGWRTTTSFIFPSHVLYFDYETFYLPYLPVYKSTRCISRPSKIREKLPILSYILCISRP